MAITECSFYVFSSCKKFPDTSAYSSLFHLFYFIRFSSYRWTFRIVFMWAIFSHRWDCICALMRCTFLFFHSTPLRLTVFLSMDYSLLFGNFYLNVCCLLLVLAALWNIFRLTLTNYYYETRAIQKNKNVNKKFRIKAFWHQTAHKYTTRWRLKDNLLLKF